jgi:putative oxidoreductase
LTKTLDNLQPWGAFLMRLVLGIAMLSHGYSKVVPSGGLNHGHLSSALDHYAHSITEFGLPIWLGYVSALTEFIGGMCILLGFLTRFAALMISADMIFAVILVTRHHGYTGSEYPLALLVIASMLAFYGAGNLALDRRIGLS